MLIIQVTSPRLFNNLITGVSWGLQTIEQQCNKKLAKILSMNFFQKLLIGHVLLSQMVLELADFYSSLQMFFHRQSAVLRKINGITKLSSTKLIRLYIGLVQPVLEYECTA